MATRIAVCALLALALFATNGLAQTDATVEQSESGQLIESALRFELDGDNKYRELALRAAAQLDPQEHRARWLLGELQVGDRWVKFTSLNRSPNQDSTLEEYRKLRNKALGDLDAEMELGRWCQKRRMHDRAEVHLRRVLDSSDASAQQRARAAELLGVTRVGDQWLTRSEVKRRRVDSRLENEAYRRWAKQIQKWTEYIDGKVSSRRERALQELRSVASVDAIPALEGMLSLRSEQYALEVVDILQQISAAESTDSLVRHALDSQWESVAVASAGALKSRPKEDYVPSLLSALQKPLVAKTQIVSNGRLRVAENLVMDEEKDQTRISKTTFVDPTSGATEETDLARAMIRARQIENQVRRGNTVRTVRNARAFEVLKQTTGEILRDEPDAWWQWWDDYNGIYTSEEPKPTVVQEQYVSTVPPPPRHECFKAGTLVWTESGQSRIELVQPGDLVVAQDPATGEVALKPVINVTLRPPGEMMSVIVDGTEIISTLGHPFWVNQHGWKMARELEPGHHVHGLEGALIVDSARRLGERHAAYNLIVGDFGTYFVTEKAILVHDNSGRGNTEAIVPGLSRTEKEIAP